jgi:hydroxymethylpyrimidine pyrophosphatase-like HAD family hydrolase
LLDNSGKELGLPDFDSLVFVGDSPNDEPMFGAFELSVGVANVKPYLPRLKTPPKFLTTLEAGAGFKELSKLLLKQ